MFRRPEALEERGGAGGQRVAEVLGRKLHPLQPPPPSLEHLRRSGPVERQLRVRPVALQHDLQPRRAHRVRHRPPGEGVVAVPLRQRALHPAKLLRPAVGLGLVAREEAVRLDDGQEAAGAQQGRPGAQQGLHFCAEVLHRERAPDEVRRPLKPKRGQREAPQVVPHEAHARMRRLGGVQHRGVAVDADDRVPAPSPQQRGHLARPAAHVHRRQRRRERSAGAAAPVQIGFAPQRHHGVEHGGPLPPGSLRAPLRGCGFFGAVLGCRHASPRRRGRRRVA
mmetsp:Transcript_6709/g.27357  ORF Transcript_6709/g.27357 Transcript_6709/m.27357 type:complete len:280 (+) Transcript_6709:1325-2164(+)